MRHKSAVCLAQEAVQGDEADEADPVFGFRQKHITTL